MCFVITAMIKYEKRLEVLREFEKNEKGPLL